jgi:hypothetical protein
MAAMTIANANATKSHASNPTYSQEGSEGAPAQVHMIIPNVSAKINHAVYMSGSSGSLIILISRAS